MIRPERPAIQSKRPRHGRILCVCSVSIVCILKRMFQHGRGMSIVADAADDADGAMESVLTPGRYCDCPRSQPPLAAEDNLNSEDAEEGLSAAQPASECAGALWP